MVIFFFNQCQLIQIVTCFPKKVILTVQADMKTRNVNGMAVLKI